MTKGFIYEIKDFIKSKNVLYCFISSLFFGVLSYLYLFMNNLHNWDNMYNTPAGYGAGTSSGRWFLTLIGEFIHKVWGKYNVPLFNGIVAIIILGVASCIIVKTFDIKNKWLCALIGGITVVFPPIASTMIYIYTVGYYALAILFIALGVLLVKELRILGFILGSLLFSCSLGIYQAYYPLCASIFILILIKMCMDSKSDIKEIILTGFKFLFSLALGYILYKFFLQCCLHIYNIELSPYQGIDKMGKIDISLIPSQINDIFKSMITLTRDNYRSISITRIVQVSFLYIYIISAIVIIIKFVNKILNKESVLKTILLGIFIIIFPIAVNFIVIMVPHGHVHTLMQMAFVCIFYLVILLVDNIDVSNLSENKINIFDKFKMNKVLLYSTLVIVFTVIVNYVWQSNGNYVSLYYNNRQIENYYETLLTRVKSIEGYNQDMPIYFVGAEIDDRTFSHDSWSYTPFKYGENTYPVNSYSRGSYIANYLGYVYTEITKDSEEYKQYQDEIDKMERYPNDKSIKIIDNKVFVRFE